VRRFFSLVRAVECIGVTYSGAHPIDRYDLQRGLRARPIHYRFRYDGLALWSFTRYDHLPIAIEQIALSRRGVWKIDEHTLLEHASGL
jgi:hypothetical protein